MHIPGIKSRHSAWQILIRFLKLTGETTMPCSAVNSHDSRDRAIVIDSLNQCLSSWLTVRAAGANRMGRLMPGRSFLAVVTVVTAAILEQASLLLPIPSVRTLGLLTSQAYT